MNLTIPADCAADVLDDLAALMLAGEASAGTRRFLEAYAKDHPEFAARLASPPRLDLGPPPAAGEDESLRTLRLVRQYSVLRSIFTGMGIAFTLIPFSFGSSPDGVRFLFLNRHEGIVYASWSIAAASWVACWIMHRQLRKRGL